MLLSAIHQHESVAGVHVPSLPPPTPLHPTPPPKLSQGTGELPASHSKWPLAIWALCSTYMCFLCIGLLPQSIPPSPPTLCPQVCLCLHFYDCPANRHLRAFVYVGLHYKLHRSHSVHPVNVLLFSASLVAQTIRNLPPLQKTGFDSWVEKIAWRKKWLLF